jgi:hypothetical protein
VKHAPSQFTRALRALGVAALVATTTTACRQDMHDAAKYEPLEYSAFFKDHRSERPEIPGTIARGGLREDKLLYTGKDGDALSETFPFPVTAGVLERGRERFNIYCSPCHGRTGDGNGMIPQRGYKHPPTYHDDRMRSMAPGYFVSVMTNGFATMPSYALQVHAEDRWAIAAYIKALQLSRHANVADLTADEKTRLEKGETEPPAGAGSEEESPEQGKEAHGG